MPLKEHKAYFDNRGSYTSISTNLENIQWDQCSISTNPARYTFRGLHYQTNPPQTKYIKVIQGSIIDFIVDLETNEVYSFDLSYSNDKALLIPDNYAHGFLTLEPDTIVVYMVKGEYNPESEHSIVWDKVPKVKEIINQYTDKVIISEKDEQGK